MPVVVMKGLPIAKLSHYRNASGFRLSLEPTMDLKPRLDQDGQRHFDLG